MPLSISFFFPHPHASVPLIAIQVRLNAVIDLASKVSTMASATKMGLASEIERATGAETMVSTESVPWPPQRTKHHH
jgi:hypothetical protein